MPCETPIALPVFSANREIYREIHNLWMVVSHSVNKIADKAMIYDQIPLRTRTGNFLTENREPFRAEQGPNWSVTGIMAEESGSNE
jgi:hypothetical protein